MGRSKVLGAAATAAVALALSACAGSSGSSDGTAGSTAGERRDPPSTTTAPAPGADPSATAPRAVPAAFRFSAPALDGGRVDGADYASTGLALWFWAPW